MIKNSLLKNDLLFNLLNGRSTRQFLIASVFSLGFSICVILCTFGLMDGFEKVLKLSLKKSSGDIVVTSREGFFEPSLIQSQINSKFNSTSLINSEGFLLFNESSKGVALKGIDPISFSMVTGLELDLKHDSVAVGKELASELDIKLGDEVVLVLGKGNESLSEMPLLIRAPVTSIFSHGIYEKDLRFVYCSKEFLSKNIGIENKINQALISIPQDHDLDLEVKNLNKTLSSEFVIKPYWSEFSSMLEAVKVEKLSITIVLQLIVIVSIFNIIAFILYLNERRVKEIFLLRALGFSQKKMTLMWTKLIFVIWFLACALSIAMTHIFEWMLKNLKFLKLPPQIYILENFGLDLSFKSYMIVFSLALIWLFLVTIILILKNKTKSIVVELKKGFVS